jgi:hypothetical protein
MDANDKRNSEKEIGDLLVAMTMHGDHHEDEKAVKLFIADGTWIRGGKPYTGHKAMLESFKVASPTAVIRHITCNWQINFSDDRSAESVTYYVAYRHDPGTAEPKFPLPLGAPFSMGEWHDRFVRTPEGWRFSRREVKRLFQRPGD